MTGSEPITTAAGSSRVMQQSFFRKPALRTFINGLSALARV